MKFLEKFTIILNRILKLIYLNKRKMNLDSNVYFILSYEIK